MKNMPLRSVYAYSPAVFAEAVRMVKALAGALSPLVTCDGGFGDVDVLFERLSGRSEEIKLLVHPQGAAL